MAGGTQNPHVIGSRICATYRATTPRRAMRYFNDARFPASLTPPRAIREPAPKSGRRRELTHPQISRLETDPRAKPPLDDCAERAVAGEAALFHA